MNWAELWIFHVLIVRNNFAIHVIRLLSATYFDMEDFRHCETCTVFQWALVDIEELEVLQDEGIRGWVFPIRMFDPVDFLLCFLAPFDALEETTQEDPINDGGIQ